MKTRRALLWLCLVLACSPAPASAGQRVRIRDLVRVEGERQNQLVGYGLVVGLEGTGDSAQVAFTNQAVRNLVTRFGNRPDVTAQIKTKNAAVVMLTADLPAFVKPGDRIDVVVSSLGDARSLQGGVLLQAPLQGADGRVYAVAQGAVSLGGFGASGAGARVTKNHPTVGRIPNGALVEAEVPMDIVVDDRVSLCLRRPDYGTAARIAAAIVQSPFAARAAAVDGGTVEVEIPEAYRGRVTDFLADLGELTVEVGLPAKVVVNERTGTIVVTGPVTISPVAVAHGSLTVEVHTSVQVSQPPPLSGGQTVAAPESAVSASEARASLARIQAATVDDLVEALNALRATPRDIIAILQALKEAGALHADLEVL